MGEEDTVSELYPTPTRLALLADVAAGEVWQNSKGHSVVILRDDLCLGERKAKCTGAIADMERAGWLQLVELKYGSRQWHVTDAGRAVLNAHGGERDG